MGKYGVKKICDTCRYFIQKSSNGKGICDRNYTKKETFKGDTCKNHFFSDGFRHTGIDCFITTAVVTMLGYADDCTEMQNLRKIREYLMQNEETQDLLAVYDIIGPIIANKLFEEKRFDIADEAFIYYIEPCSILVSEGNFEKAIQQYEEMIIRMAELLSVDLDIGRTIVDDYKKRSKALGHGKILVKEKLKKNDDRTDN